jgi:hypothetical protein
MAKKKEKDPCFLFYSQDWIMGTYTMTQAQKGSYVDLLALQHQGVAITDDTVKKTCENKRKDIDVVLTKFVRGKDGLYYNEKLKKVMEERALYRFKQSQNASKRSATAKPTHQPNFSTHVEDEDKEEDIITIEDLDAKQYQNLNDLYNDLP